MSGTVEEGNDVNRLGTVSAVLVASLALGGTAAAAHPSTAGATTVNVTLDEFSIKMARKSLPVNTTIRFAIKNSGAAVHEVVLERAGCKKKCALESKGREAEVEHIAKGATKSFTWKIAKAGKYALTCRIKGHHEAGMFVNFAVK
jgi:uncharacterized cupredoxin-like copper-binding protein